MSGEKRKRTGVGNRSVIRAAPKHAAVRIPNWNVDPNSESVSTKNQRISAIEDAITVRNLSSTLCSLASLEA